MVKGDADVVMSAMLESIENQKRAFHVELRHRTDQQKQMLLEARRVCGCRQCEPSLYPPNGQPISCVAYVLMKDLVTNVGKINLPFPENLAAGK